MALADYSTSVEKIAALQAALMDPAIMQITLSPFTTTETIYIIRSISLSLNGVDFAPSNGMKIDSGNDVDLYNGAPFDFYILYVKDSDIVYSDPVSTYQDRLEKIYTGQYIDPAPDTPFTTGQYGSISVNPYSVDTITPYGILYYGTGEQGLYKPYPISTQLKNGSSNTSLYFDVPVDW